MPYNICKLLSFPSLQYLVFAGLFFSKKFGRFVFIVYYCNAFANNNKIMLFQKNIIKKYISSLDEEDVQNAWNCFKKYFQNPDIQQNIRQSKEEQFQEGFLRELFVKVFGYTLHPSPNYNLITEKKNETNAQKADGAIVIDDNVIGVIELKDTKTTDLSKIEAQAFGYKLRETAPLY